jgi:pimeloyl-ACP methyl ester carboxylesterase
MPYVKTKDSTDLYVKDWGSGRPVILLHGWPLTADSWDDQALALANAGHRVIFYDRRGFGRSGQPWSGYDYDTFADDLAAVIEATGVQDATLIGFSMGGGEVARYLSRHDGKGIAQAGLISSVVPYMLKDDSNPDGVDGSVFEQMQADIRADRPNFMATFAQQFYGVGWISSPVSQEVVDDFSRQALMAGLKGTLDCVDAFGRTDFRGDLAAFRVPTLIIHGTSDNTVPIDPSGRAAAAAISHGRYIEYSGAPHGLNVTEKERFTQDLLDFVKS